MNTSLHQFVLDHLAARRVKWSRVSRETGIPYETLKKIGHRTTPNPGVLHVQTLADYFQKQSQEATQPMPVVKPEEVAESAQDANAMRTGAVRRVTTRRVHEFDPPGQPQPATQPVAQGV